MQFLKKLGYGILLLVIVFVGGVWSASSDTEQDIHDFQSRVADLAKTTPGPELDRANWSALPEPVQKYFDFVFQDEAKPLSIARLTAEGQFRRPLTESFSFTTAEQVIAIGQPALMFSATTSVFPGVWARAYDFFAQGEMEMKAKILSMITVVDEQATPELNQVSLRRWLLESALYPQALLPGGVVSWEAIDTLRARAIVEQGDLQASMVAYFDPAGHMTHMQAEDDGDLTTPYHGSGEHVSRSDYQLIGQQMIPMAFTISRAAGGELYPFWDGRISNITFEE